MDDSISTISLNLKKVDTLPVHKILGKKKQLILTSIWYKYKIVTHYIIITLLFHESMLVTHYLSKSLRLQRNLCGRWLQLCIHIQMDCNFTNYIENLPIATAPTGHWQAWHCRLFIWFIVSRPELRREYLKWRFRPLHSTCDPWGWFWGIGNFQF